MFFPHTSQTRSYRNTNPETLTSSDKRNFNKSRLSLAKESGRGLPKQDRKLLANSCSTSNTSEKSYGPLPTHVSKGQMVSPDFHSVEMVYNVDPLLMDIGWSPVFFAVNKQCFSVLSSYLSLGICISLSTE